MDERSAKGAARSRNILMYTLLRPAVTLFAVLRFGYTWESLPSIEGGYLMLANHNTSYDMLFTAAASRRHMYYVASEHVMHGGWASRLLKWALGPIIRRKGGIAAATVMAITRSLRNGDGVCLFAEGNRSFDGRTCRIMPSTGKLAKAGGATLVTYRLEHGYLAIPRWAYTIRRGGVRGRVMNIYPPERLRSMTAEEINSAIQADLYEDAAKRQLEEMRPFPGSRLAEGLEHALYICPECGRMGRMASSGSTLSCECGMNVVYDKYGFLTGCRFTSVAEWNEWQRGELEQRLSAPEGLIISDEGAALYRVNEDHGSELLFEGRMELSGGTIRLGGYAFPLNELDGMAIYGRSVLVLPHGGCHYEVRGRGRFCGLKYVHAYELITGKMVI